MSIDEGRRVRYYALLSIEYSSASVIYRLCTVRGAGAFPAFPGSVI